MTPAGEDAARIPAPDGDQPGRGHQGETQQDSGKQAGQKQRHDGHAAACRDRVDDHVVRRRNEQAGSRAGRGDVDGEIPRIALLAHDRRQRRSHRRNARHGRTRDRAEHHAGEHAHLPQSASGPAQHGFRQTHQLGRDTRLVHEFAGKNKERNGEQRKHVDTGRHALERHDQGNVQVKQGRQRRKAETEGYRHAESQQNHEATEKYH